VTPPVPATCPEHEVGGFLVREAGLLDSGDYEAWLKLLTEDIVYQMPVRSTRYGNGADEFSATSFHLNEDLYSLRLRIARLRTRFAWAEDPPTRTRHFVSNVMTLATDESGITVRSSVLLYRSRMDDPAEMLTAERRDVLRRTPQGLRLAQRTVLTDQSSLTMSAITTFL
jgi:3-phenylpropionate/cinnamic acid dioxygenase small subunit